MCDRRADCTAMADYHHVFLRMQRGKPFERIAHTIDDLGERLTAGWTLVAGQRPERVLRQ